MKALLAIPAALVTMALSLLSAPWLILTIGLQVLGDEDAADRVMDTSPIGLFLNYVEGRDA